ncbi:cyclin-like protein [Blastocladiella britannica]|nr:cyclin-like protein [Blastocladiella britannica]KAI9221050.1 cyclin-like protein [Blastocladiella britannica]
MQKLQQQQQQALDAQYYDAEGDATADGSLVPENARAKRLRLLEEIQDESDALLLVVTNEDGDKSYAVDIDQDDIDDPAMCAEYAAEIMDYLMDRETHFAPDPQYIVRHGEIKWGMRAILVDWIVEVHGKFKFLPETLFLATNIMDRFLTRRVCSLDKFQLVGLVALFVAAKTEEVFCPAADQFVFMADNAFTKDDLLGAEQYLLRVLEFDLWAPGPLSFIRRISKMDDYSAPHRNAAKYFAEMTLLDHRFLEYPMSQVAAASMYLARNIHKCEEWSPMLVQASGYTENEILPVVSLLIDWMSKHRGTDDNGEGAFFIKKYGAKKATKFVRAALIWVANRKGMAEYIQWVVDEAAARDAAAEDAGRVAADPAAVDDHRGRSFEPASPPRGSTTAPVAATTRARGTAAGGKRGNGASQEPAAF